MFYHSASSDKRHHKRFLVQGQAQLRLPAGDLPNESLEVLNVGGGGILLFSKVPPSLGTEVQVRFTVQGYNCELAAKARVVRVEGAGLGLAFLETPPGIDDLVAWLDAGLIATFL